MQIRNAQMKALEEDGRRRFEEEMMAHSREFAEPICKIIGDEQLRIVLRSAMSRAADYGFTLRGPIRLFIEMTFLSGSGFDTDPQYPEVGKVLRASDHEMVRAEKIHQGYQDYLARVSGPRAANVHTALKGLLSFAQKPPIIPADNFVPFMLGEMRRVFPQKTAYVGEAALTALIHEAAAVAQKYEFPSVREQALIAVLMFAFGHGCTNDPLYPWISNTLRDSRIVDAAARARRLEKKAVTWLEHVVARNERRNEGGSST